MPGSGQESQGVNRDRNLPECLLSQVFEGEGLWRQEKKVLRAAGAGRQCVWVRQMRGSEVISEWRRGGQGGGRRAHTRSRASALFLPVVTGHQLGMDRGRSPGNSCHRSPAGTQGEEETVSGE